jgi:folate-binding protein YgfZ
VSAAGEAAAVRRGAGIFRLGARRVLAVRGADRVRWLDGMLSNDVRSLGAERAGCHACVLTRTGRVVADLHVLWRPEEIWLDLEAAAVAPVRTHLEKFIIADDVRLDDASIERLGVEGPEARAVLEAAAPGLPALESSSELHLAGHSLQMAAWGFSGELAFQLFAPPDSSAVLVDALLEAGRSAGALEAGPEALEILRIEAGIPRFGTELDESVLPDEARLDAAVSTTKGCYTGQEVVARLRSRGQVSHRLVGLQSEGESPLPVGSEVALDGTRIGEVTSACVSPSAGAIALAFLRRPHHEPGTGVLAAGRPARVAALPFVRPHPARG